MRMPRNAWRVDGGGWRGPKRGNPGSKGNREAQSTRQTEKRKLAPEKARAARKGMSQQQKLESETERRKALEQAMQALEAETAAQAELGLPTDGHSAGRLPANVYVDADGFRLSKAQIDQAWEHVTQAGVSFWLNAATGEALKACEAARDAGIADADSVRTALGALQARHEKTVAELDEIKGSVRVLCRLRPLHAEKEDAQPTTKPVPTLTSDGEPGGTFATPDRSAAPPSMAAATRTFPTSSASAGGAAQRGRREEPCLAHPAARDVPPARRHRRLRSRRAADCSLRCSSARSRARTAWPCGPRARSS